MIRPSLHSECDVPLQKVQICTVMVKSRTKIKSRIAIVVFLSSSLSIFDTIMTLLLIYLFTFPRHKLLSQCSEYSPLLSSCFMHEDVKERSAVFNALSRRSMHYYMMYVRGWIQVTV